MCHTYFYSVFITKFFLEMVNKEKAGVRWEKSPLAQDVVLYKRSVETATHSPPSTSSSLGEELSVNASMDVVLHIPTLTLCKHKF